MPYLKPPTGLIFKLFHKVALLLGYSGTVALLVEGRKTGTLQKIPVIPLEYQGARYLVSVRGESEWVRNVRAAGSCQLQKGTKVERLKAIEVAAAIRPPLIEAFRKTAEPRSVIDDCWAKLPDAADHPIFRLE